MEVDSDQFERTYLDLLTSMYGKQGNFKYFFGDVKKALKYSRSNPHQRINYFLVGDRACFAFIRDNRLGDDEGLFGFFEVPENITVFQELWIQLAKVSKDYSINTLLGPVNATAWHQYRVIRESDNSPFFKTEMMCMPYYHEYLQSLKPIEEIKYHSGYREKFDVIVEATRPAYEGYIGSEFEIKKYTKLDEGLLSSILNIIDKTFNSNWGFVPLTLKDFANLYSGEKLSEHLNNVYLLSKDGEIIGFLSTFEEDASTLIIKTLGVLPEYRSLGLGNTLAHKAHVDALEKGYKKIIYALVQEDNNIKRFPKGDAIIFRQYSTFKFDVSGLLQ